MIAEWLKYPVIFPYFLYGFNLVKLLSKKLLRKNVNIPYVYAKQLIYKQFIDELINLQSFLCPVQVMADPEPGSQGHWA